MAAPTVDEFRQHFPEFDDPETYPDDAIEFWLTEMYGDLNADRLGTKLNVAAELAAAHMLVIGRRNETAAGAGSTPGGTSGVVSSRSVDKVSVSYDVSMMTEAGIGFWATTNYGQRFWWILRQRCLGPVYRAPPDVRFIR